MRKRKRNGIKEKDSDVLERIINADSDILVRDIVSVGILASLPSKLAANFGDMLIRWDADRSYNGLSFGLDESIVHLGNVKGHQMGQHPAAHGLTPEQSCWIVCTELEGVLLHELGHAMIDEYMQRVDEKATKRKWAKIIEAEGAVSTYDLDEDECIAEAVRWYIAAPGSFRRRWPRQADIVSVLIANAGTVCGRLRT